MNIPKISFGRIISPNYFAKYSRIKLEKIPIENAIDNLLDEYIEINKGKTELLNKNKMLEQSPKTEDLFELMDNINKLDKYERTIGFIKSELTGMVQEMHEGKKFHIVG